LIERFKVLPASELHMPWPESSGAIVACEMQQFPEAPQTRFIEGLTLQAFVNANAKL